MSVSIRVSDGMYNEARQVANAEYRSIPSQIEFWAMIGKCALDNPDLPIDFVKDLLIAKHTDIDLAEPFSFEHEG